MKKNQDIHPDLQEVGLLAVLPKIYSRKTSAVANHVLYKSIGHQVQSPFLRMEEHFIKRSDGSLLRLCVYLPKKTTREMPGLVWFHGGGYSMGIPEMDERSYEALMETRPSVIVAPDYRRSIDAPYPAALIDGYLALKWLKKHGTDFGCRLDQLMVAGNSAGGGLTVALALLARDRKEINLAFQMPLYPMLDDRMITDSARSNRAPVWNSRANRIAWKLYLDNQYGSKNVSIYAAPARNKDVKGLPPACTYVGSIEPFFDETVAYVRRLKQAGIPVAFKIFPGAYHGFSQVKPDTELAKQAQAFMKKNYAYAVDHFFMEQVEK
ncbi:alpha/beta hydrolase [Enterococcus florum]|uniref:Alpha/beta hydrolase n=1 Tax=Enterococcus florum TaxID=2480627 RepID=A0A4P5P6E3_9ENTE|nr:alpha/beta hydrolase [Enterococcus florum]GCF92966.1 alpha/beta hydrolase [Enterococcus florum]